MQIAAPIGLARLSQITGNPALDVMLQFCDLVPYFCFNGQYYTRVHPDNADGVTVNVYTLTSVVVDGASHDAMTYAGTGTQTGQALTYGGAAYRYVSTVNIRQFAINKWSKRKPIRYPKLAELTSEERLGTIADRTEGYVYGVRLFTDGSDYVKLHDVVFDYKCPTIGYGYARLTDFIGYDPDAMPTAYAQFPSTELYYDLSTWTTIPLVVGSDTGTGIDIVSVIEDISSAVIGEFYAFVLIDHYACCLRNMDEGECTPIYYNGQWMARAGFNLSDLNTQHGFTGGDVKGTIFLSQGSTLSGGASLPIDGTWEDIKDKIYAYPGYALPEGTGVDLHIISYGHNAKQAKVTGLSGSTSRLLVMYGWVDETPTEETQIQVTASVEGMSATWEGTFTPDGATYIPSFLWSELGLVVSSGNVITVSATIRTKVDGDVGWTEGQAMTETEVTIP